MPLTPGVRLGPYEILAPLGAGGMGEVYRARDTRLDRTVAIKILPHHLSEKPAAKERFEREARAISSLSHPNICHLYDVGSQDGVGYLVMEYLEGETLAERLIRGPLPLEQVLRYGIEICEGLEKAHRTGVVHRDLKPGNIMLTKAGARLMDFGLAKPAVLPLGSDSSSLKTKSQPLTAEGTLVGTFQYMSPEQVEGKEVGGQSDLFSLGAVLYEMVTGRRAFEGKSQLSVASAILEKEPEPIPTVKPMTPPALDHAIRTCLAKDPEKRWQTGRDLAHALEWIAAGGSQAVASAARARGGRTRERLLAAGLIVTAAVALALGYLQVTRAPTEERVTRSYIKPMTGSSFILSDAAGFALSPDGRRLAFIASTPDGKSAVWVRPIDSLRAEPLAGTNGATYPFWSPDGRFVGFFAGAKLKKIDLSGGPPFTLCDASDGRGGTWNREGEILFTPSVNAALYRVSAGGGQATPVTALDSSRNELSHRWPQFLPDGRHFLYLAGSVFTSMVNPTNSIRLGSLDSKGSDLLFYSHAGALYASGQILFLRQDTLMARPFDPERRKLTGDAVPIADPVPEVAIFSRGLFSASENGLLAYIEGTSSADRELVWYDRRGKQVGAVPGADAYACPRISPDGKKLLFYLDASGYDIWSYDMARGVKTPQTFGSSSTQSNVYAVWSPDGRRIAYGSYRDGKHALYQKASDGSSGEELLLEGEARYKFPTDWSPDGKVLAYQEGKPGGWAIWMIPMDGERKPYLFHESQFSEREAAFSPDGKWLAFCSNESGEYKVYVAPNSGSGGRWQVSPGGGSSPRWRRDGQEILYLSSDNKIMAAEVSAHASSFEVGSIRTLFETRPYGPFGRFDVTADGQQFIVPFEAGRPTTAITLVVNWPADLKR
ncbi:MAG TPA: protein kinase [Candidatus Polarisedimenticolia bacterium]|jgi:Tol biopolymer transport system component